MRTADTERRGLRVTVRLHDTIVSQRVHWQPLFGSGSRFELGPEVPTPSGQPLAVAQWGSDGQVQIESQEPTADSAAIGSADQWQWSNQQGVTVDLDLIPYRPARKSSDDAWGDVALLVFMLTLMVGVGQVNTLLRQLGTVSPTVQTVYEPTPELIARLLQRDLDGEESGRTQRAERPGANKQAPSFYLPAGHEGSWEQAGGGADIGQEVQRGGESEAELAQAEPASSGAEAIELNTEDLAQAPDAPPQATPQVVELELEAEPEGPALARPIERFIGWGFKDWFEVEDGRGDQEEQIARIMESTRVKLKIDPDDPQAIQTAAYYSYLSENQELTSALHERYIELYPWDPSGYNNLALSHKRTGEYEEEEALYRIALKLDPSDPHALNNLAVNLAHQGRFDEALRLMASVEELTPDDPYADLHRAKIFAAMGKKRKSYSMLKKALANVDKLDTLHHIEFRQDIRVDPVFDKYRSKWGFKRIIRKKYGDDADAIIGKTTRHWWQGSEVADG
jgi:tetratricopeptide (TPR) repeat protein